MTNLILLIFTGSQTLIGYLMLALITVLSIAIARSLQDRYNAWISLKRRFTSSMMAVAITLSFVLMGFNWTSYEAKVIYDEPASVVDWIINPPPRTPPSDPPPPPPPPPEVEEVPNEEILEDDEPEFKDQDIDEDSALEEPEKEEKKEVEAPPPPPPPPPSPPVVDEIFKVVEQMPRFPGCENEPGDNAAKKKCADQKMLQYIYKNLKYPAIAAQNGIEGMCVIQFVISTSGEVTQAKIVRNIGGGCGEAALLVVNKMNNLPQKWTPGKQRGTNVKVLYTLPVRFRLKG